MSVTGSFLSSTTNSELVRRQDNTTANIEPPSASGTTTATPDTATTTLSSAIATVTGKSGSQMMQLGPYQCSDDLSLDNLINILKGWINLSSDPIRARFIILQLNIHATADPDDPAGVPQTPTSSELPSSGELVGSRFDAQNLGGYIYKPSDLVGDRANLNASWFSVSAQNRLPVIGYYELNEQGDHLATSNGWPSEAFLLFNQYKRLLLTYDVVSPEMSGYDVEGDSDWAFPSNRTKFSRDPDVNAQGLVTSGCYYSDSEMSVAGINNSWAITNVEDYSGPPQLYLQNLTSCGFGPILNFTLNKTADADYQIYQNFTQGTLFGWAPGEPRNASTTSDLDGPEDQYRCVVLDSSNTYRGHWRSANCQEKYRMACRVGGAPFDWTLSSSEVPYMNVVGACPDGSEPGIPRTGLESTYLYEHILRDLERQDTDSFREGVWINLNSLDVQNCWITTGPNGSCTYSSDAQERHNREVLIPSIAALIVLILTVLTILVKCSVNRRKSRVRRMGPGGWEYEGVPS